LDGLCVTHPAKTARMLMKDFPHRNEEIFPRVDLFNRASFSGRFPKRASCLVRTKLKTRGEWSSPRAKTALNF
jgi:hypothetical protein